MKTRIDDKDEPEADDPRWLSSAMADGEADAAELVRGLAAWDSADPRMRQSWHAYHLIGDVLRSEDLASPPEHDHRFLERLCLRLDDEPAVLAPRPLAPALPTRRSRSWLMPAALAAGVMGLATVLVSSLTPGGGTPAPLLAAAPYKDTAVATVTPTAVAPVAAQVAEVVPPGGAVLRDAQLDRYLRAHRDYATALPGSLPGGSGRSIATVSLDR